MPSYLGSAPAEGPTAAGGQIRTLTRNARPQRPMGVVPSITHQDLVRLFDERPGLAAELLQRCLGVKVPTYRYAGSEKETVGSSRPVELHVDAVVSYKRSKRRPVFAVLVEVQLSAKNDKRYSWPVYVASVRRRLKCPVALLVVTLDARVARWARRAIVVGPGATLTPSVLLLGPDVMPVVTSWRQAARQPELALLSVMAHGKGDPEQAIRIAHAAFAGARQAANARRLDEEAAVVYSTAICEALGPAARKAFEMYPDIERFFDSATRKKIHKARAEGKAEGKAEGRADAVRAKRDAVLAVLHARGLTLTDRQRARIAACMDDAKLDTWLRRAVTAPSTTAVFARRPAKNTPRASSASSSPPRRSRSRASAARSSASRASPR